MWSGSWFMAVLVAFVDKSSLVSSLWGLKSMLKVGALREALAKHPNQHLSVGSITKRPWGAIS